MLIGIISDPHMPRRARALPAECVEQLETVDLILHAGDITTAGALAPLRGDRPAASSSRWCDGFERVPYPCTP